MKLPEVIRLWDTLFSEVPLVRFGKNSFIYYFCVAMVSCRSEKLLNSNFAECMEELQRTVECTFDEVFTRYKYYK